MPRFFLHIRNGDEYLRDPEGSELSDIEAARTEVIEAARELGARAIRHGQNIEGVSFEISDENDRVLATVRVRDVVRSQLNGGRL